MAERDPLAEMRDQVDAAYSAADRLVREAEAAARERAEEVPERGWENPRAEHERHAFAEIQALAGLLESLRGSIPPELARQLGEAVRELLLALRALMDWWIERLDRAPEAPVEVQDIPIE
jgi:hypothetical protein